MAEGVWTRLFKALTKPKPIVSGDASVVWERADDVVMLDVDTIMNEQPDFRLPPDAARDPWRPRTNLNGP